jgi:hypothetical protein
MDKERVTSGLISSISGVLIFLSLAYWMDLNGYAKYSPLIILVGASILFFPKPYLRLTSGLGFMNKPLLLTISHILIFIGSKTYFDQYIEIYWFAYLVIGVILLNNADTISKKFFG